MNMDFVGAVEHFLDELRRNEINAFAVSDGEVAGHHGYAADSHRNVDAGQHDVIDRSWVDGSEVGGHVDFRKAVKVANAAVHDQSAAVRCLHHIVKKIV